MNLAVMQPYLFPYMGYYQLIAAVDRFVIYDDVNYINRGWINRNRILIRGEAAYFTMPLQKASQNKRICDLFIFEKEKWASTFLKTLKSAYSKSPEFDTGFFLIESIVNFKTDSLTEFLENSIKVMAEVLFLKTEIVRSAGRYGNEKLKGTERIMDICKKEKAHIYINAPGGELLYSKEDFCTMSIALKFIQSAQISYPQFGDKFVVGLSIVDVLMFNPLSEVKNFINRYALK